jgi:ABC-type phosphate transport system permease subunit
MTALATNILVGLAALLIGVFVGVTITITAQVRAVQRYNAEQIKPTSELLGEVTTNMGEGANPVVDQINRDIAKGKLR